MQRGGKRPGAGRPTGSQYSGKGLVDPSAHASVLAFIFNDTGVDVSLPSIYEEVKRLSRLRAKAKLTHIERTLMAQALALQSMFSCLAMRAEKSKFIDHFDIYVSLALKAQRQCRVTLATLADIINPARTTFIKNNAHNQQVNLGTPDPLPLPEKNSRKPRNELLRSLPHATTDKVRTLAPISTDSAVAAVAPIDRAKHPGRQGAGESERAKARPARSRASDSAGSPQAAGEIH